MIATLMLDKIRRMLESDRYRVSTENAWPVVEWNFKVDFMLELMGRWMHFTVFDENVKNELQRTKCIISSKQSR